MKNQYTLTASKFVIHYADGGRAVEDTYRGALETLGALGCYVCGHAGDLEDGGPCTYIWRTEEGAVDENPLQAFARITARYIFE